MRLAKIILAAAALAVSPALVFEASAQKGEGVTTSTIVGQWTGVADWNDDQYDGTIDFTFHADGTFSDGYGESGTWYATGAGVEIRYPSGGRTRYAGNLIEGVVIGSMQTDPPNLTGLFSIWRTN